MAEHGFGAANVRRVIAGASRVVVQQTGFPYRPSTVLNAQMSLCYNLAVALIDGHALIAQFTEARIAEPVVCDLASRVEVEVDPEMDAIYPERYAGIVTIVLDDGRRLRKRVDYSKGMPENRMTAPSSTPSFARWPRPQWNRKTPASCWTKSRPCSRGRASGASPAILARCA